MNIIKPNFSIPRLSSTSHLDMLAWTAQRLAQCALCYGLLGVMGMFMGIFRLIHHAAAAALELGGWTLLTAPGVPSAKDAAIATLLVVWGACSAASGRAAISPLERAHEHWRWRSHQHRAARHRQSSRWGA